MVTQSPDTDPGTEAMQLSLLRRASVARRISSVRSLSGSARWLSRRAILRANPELEQRDLDLRIVAYHYGERLASCLREYMDARSS